MAKKKKKKNEGEEEVQGKKKGGKKKLLLIPLALILVAAIAAAAVLFILPRFGIDLLGGEAPGPGEEEPPKNLEVFTVGGPIEGEDGEQLSDTTISLDTLLEEGEGDLVAVRKAEEQEVTGEDETTTLIPAQNTYIYEVSAPAEIVNRYLDAVLGGEEGFVLVDETYLHLEERPELADSLGTVTIARPSVQSGHVFQLVIGWSEATFLTFRATAPEGTIHEPEKEEDNKLGLGSEVVETHSLTEQIEKIQSMSPDQFGLSGDSMEDYEIYPVEGFVMVDSITCRRFNLYVPRESGSGHYPDLEAVIFLSTDQQHVYRMDPESNAVTELR